MNRHFKNRFLRSVSIAALALIATMAAMMPYPSVHALNKEDIVKGEDGKEYIKAGNRQYYYAQSVSDAAAYLRKNLLDHKETISVACAGSEGCSDVDLWDQIEKTIYKEADMDADYIEMLITGVDVEISHTKDDETLSFYDCSPCYYLTADQEKKLEADIAGLSLEGKNDYETTKNIYRYICQNISYDDDYNCLSFSAYGALENKKAVCQGFSMLFYQLGRKSGLDVGIVCGKATNEETDGWITHAWNVVKLGGQYYNLDPTWDSESDSYGYFLKGSDGFDKEHKAESHNNYKVKAAAYNIPMADREIFDSSYTGITDITLSGTAISHNIAAGKAIQLKASIAPSNASYKTLSWKSSNPKIASVNQNGKVRVRKKTGGKNVWITAAARDGSKKKAVWKIHVMKGAVKKITIKGKKKVKAGKSLKLKAKVKAGKGANKKLLWTSSNPRYAKVSSTGKVKTYKAGKGKKVKITARATDGSGKKKSFKIKIK